MNVKIQSTFLRILSLTLSILMVISIFGVIDVGKLKTYAANEAADEEFSYRILIDGSVEIMGYTGTAAEVIIPAEIDGKPVTSIGFEAFRKSELTSVTISDSINEIGKYAFYDCDNLTSITIPKNLNLIDEYALHNCDNLTNIEVSSENSVYSSENGVLFDKDKTELIQYPLKKDGTSYEIPNTVTAIKDLAFYNCDVLENVTIPSSVTAIGVQAFYGCDGLKEINIPESVTTIGKYAFAWSGLTSIEIPNGITEIADFTFYNCNGLTDINISENTKNIEKYAFYACNNLTNINVSSDNEKYSSKDGVLFNKNRTELIQYPSGKDNKSYEVPFGVTTIKDSAFYNCLNLKNVIFPNSTTKIESNAFENCGNLASITITSSNIEIEKTAFEYCGNLIIYIVNGTEIVMSSTSTDSYKIEAKHSTDASWIVLKNYDMSTTKKWTPAKVGTYNVKIKTKDSDGEETSEILTLTVNENVINNSSIDKSKIVTGTEITLTGSASEGIGPYQYRMEAKHENDTTWTVLKDYNTTATKKWTPQKTGKYDVVIKVKDSTGSVAEKLLTLEVNETLTNTSNISATEIEKGIEITLTGKASGGTEEYQYAMLAKHSSASSWTTLKSYSTTATKKWTPANTGTYKVAIKVKDSSGKVVEKIFTVTVNPAALANVSTISATSITKGTEITMTGEASGGIAPYKFQMEAKHENDTTWTVLKDYNTTATKKWTPQKTGKYDVVIKVKDSTGSVAEKLLTLEVNETLTNTSNISATEIEKGTEITLTGKASGGTEEYQYAMLAKYNGEWTVLKNYDETSEFVWTPAEIGTYKISIKVKDSAGTIEEEIFTLTVKAPSLKNDSTISATSITKGTEITMTGKASGGTSPYQYAMLAKHSSASSWTTLKSYSTTETKKWTPAKTGTYKVAIKVKDSSGKEIEEVFTLTVE